MKQFLKQLPVGGEYEIDWENNIDIEVNYYCLIQSQPKALSNFGLLDIFESESGGRD